VIVGRLIRHRDKGLRRRSSSPAQPMHPIGTMTIARRFVLALLVAVATLVGGNGSTVVLAAAPPPVAVSVSFRPPPIATIGSEVIVTGTIRRADRLAPTGLRVSLYISGKFLVSSHADANGNLAFRISGTATPKAGTFPLEARFDGAHGLLPDSAFENLKIRPAVVKVTTVPAVAGVQISVGTKSVKTGADGTATVAIDKVGPVSLEAHLDLVEGDQIRVSFVRWGDQVYDAKRQISIRGDATYVLGLRTAYRAGVQFIDQNGKAVDPTTISRARFTSSTGGELVLTSFDDVWWEAGTAVSRTAGLQPSTTLWRLSEVDMAGTNVVNQGQQAFTPTINGTWTVDLLLYDLTVHTNDAITGSALPGTAELLFPDSTSRTAPIGADGSAQFAGLPRGSYVVKLTTDGIAPSTPIALSRSQDASIRVISYLDMGLAVGFILVSLLVLLWVGRRRQLPWLMWVSAVPGAAIRRLPGRSALTAAGQRVPVVTSSLSLVRGDLARIGKGRGSAAVGFGRLLLTKLARVLTTLIAATLRLITSGLQRVVRSDAGGRARLAQTADGRVGAVDGDRMAHVDPAPAWPASTETDIRSVLHPPITVRSPKPLAQPVQHDAGTTSVRSWFDVPSEDEGPSHECKRCHRQVLDSARFCRSCGHRQD